jgi:galactokinase
VNISERLAELGMSKPAFFVPGRIEVLGKHTDYAGGRSLLCAIERGILASVAPRRDSVVRVTDRTRGETREVPLAVIPSAARDEHRGDWSNYVATVAHRVAMNFPEAKRGADITFASDLPIASGMSSSSALTIAVFLALDNVNKLSRDARYTAAIDSPEALAAYLASVEMGEGFGTLRGDRGVGTFGGSEDHTAILCCRDGFLSQYSFIPTRAEGTVALPADRTFVVAFSGVAAEKTSRAMALYNELSLATREILRLWNTESRRSDRSLGAALESDAGAASRIRQLLTDANSRRLCDRFDQFELESNQIIPRASEALAAGNLGAFGDLVSSSQLAAEHLLGNQIPETRRLVRIARTLGADAASAFGAGFGGSVWALAKVKDADAISQEWRAAYAKEFPAASTRAEFFATRPGAGARSV